MDSYGKKAGKGALLSENLSMTLGVSQDQYLFQPVILDDQGGQQISVRTDGKSPTLRAETHGNLPCVLQAFGLDTYNQAVEKEVAQPLRTSLGGDSLPKVMLEHKVFDARGNGSGEITATITGVHEHSISDYTNVVVLGIMGSNAMLSDNPHSGIYEAKTSRTLDLNGGNPACNQGGIIVCQYWDGSQTAGTLTANNAGGSQRMPDKENFNCVIQMRRR